MGHFIIGFMAIAAIFMGIYYIGSEYRSGTGFAAITLGAIVLIALFNGSLDEYIENNVKEPAEFLKHEVVHDTIIHVHEVHDTVFITEVLEPFYEESSEDSIVVEIISELPLEENEIDSIADAIIYNH
jgi:hypothetical protein